jgi:hypothetical protein
MFPLPRYPLSGGHIPANSKKAIPKCHLEKSLYSTLIHIDVLETGAVVVYVPVPPVKYLSRKSPKNGLLLEKFSSLIVPSNVTLARLVQP